MSLSCFIPRVCRSVLRLGFLLGGVVRADLPPAVLDLTMAPAVINTRPGPEYSDQQRDFAMVIGMDRTPKGRIWAAWVAGGDSPRAYFVAASSDDNGAAWSKPRLVIDPPDASTGLEVSALVGNFWTDPTGRLWLFYDQSLGMFDGRAGLWAITCDNPDDDSPVWSAPRRIWHGMTLNKPVVLKNGEWLLPVSLWTRDRIGPPDLRESFHELDDVRMANILVSTDQGATWTRRGGVTIPETDFDEHMFVELKDGRLWLLARTKHGIAESYSSDQGRTWTEAKPSTIQNVSARFFLRRLASGHLFLVKNGPLDQRLKGRSHLTAFLSDDDGRTWNGGLVIDERNGVSYPDGFQSPDGAIHILYDRERAKEREILMARFTEADVLAGKLVSRGSQMKMLVNKAYGKSRAGPVTGAVRTGPARHLFLDPAFVQAAEGAALHVNPPQQREIVIRPDKPWEQLMISFFLTVRDEEGRLRMWYICRDKANHPNVAYAESRDGVQWTKPNLGIVEYEGSKENNLVGLTSLEGVVFQDPNAPAQERYTYVTHLITEGMVRFHSPDGWRWQRDPAPLLRLGADTQNVTFWDERIGKYALYLRGWYRGADQLLYRKAVRAELPSLTSPLPVDPSEKSLRLWGRDKVAVIGGEFPTVFAADEHDPKNSDVYNLAAQPYPLDRRWYVGFPSMFQRERNTSDGRLEMHFIGSRDGIAWHRYDRAPYVKPGPEGSESASMVFMGTGLVVRGDEIWQYGTGLWSRHGDREARQRKTDGVIFRYVQRVDGFVSLDFEPGGGWCRTAPVKVDGPGLVLNLDTGALGTFRVGLLDAGGKTISGFGAEDCVVLRTNATRALVEWKRGGDLTALKDREVRLAFTGTRAKLYGFQFTHESP